MLKLRLLLPVMLMVLVALSAPVQAAPVKIYGDAQDGQVYSGGLVDSVGVYLAVGDTIGVWQGFVKFGLSGVSGTLSSARMYLYVVESYRNNIPDLVSPLDNPLLGDCQVIHIADYGTLDITDFNSPSIGNDPGVLIPGTGPGSTPNIGYVSIDIKAAMQDDINNGRSFCSFMIKMDTDGDNSQDTWNFRASEMTGTDQDPYIEYELVRTTPVTPRPVGGIVASTDKITIVTPYLALAALVIVSAVVVVKRRSKD